MNTVALAGVVLFIGYGIRRVVKPLGRYNVPAPVIGGLLWAVVILIGRQMGREFIQYDTTLQNPLMVVVCVGVVFWLMGRDYEAAVMTGGFCGFMLGTTANAIANMEALVEKYGPAPRAFLVAPIVGAFFIDFTNALIITAFLNWFNPHVL